MWCRAVAGLADRVTLELVDRPPSSAGVKADVWLADGHSGALNVEEPVVAAIHEVGWTTRALRSFLDPSFACAFSARTTAGVLSAARVLTPSESSRRQVLDAYDVPAERVHTVPYGVDLGVFRPGLTGGRAGVGAMTATDDPPYVLFVATLHPRKNLAAVRQAVARLARRGFDHVLVLVAADASDRDDSSELRRAAEAELPAAPGRIVSVPTGEDSELAMLMAGADAVCLPSFSEGFGLTALEAMACGAPVIVSDRGALPEVVGGSGLIVPPTAEGVERALVRIFSDAAFAAQLRGAARVRAEGFTWERMVGGWLNVLERAAAEAREPSVVGNVLRRAAADVP
ncbi:MAG: glycosyltransferase family 4 protein [Actinomycetota bacterium]|nr:glycosyltransferase family 4 protein [Actinomycetota bacterium]MDQ3720795.1 glycosyltransferase family 4 protein [Actinomycetota bacterium]